MIINSMSRKEPSFSQLIDYMGYLSKESAVFGMSYNLYSDRDDTQGIISEFEDNYAYLPSRINGNALYHEIIALPPDSTMPRRKQMQALKELAMRYVERRAENHLAYGVIHTDTPHLHMHLVISSNTAYGRTRHRLSKKEFAELQEEMERYKLEHYKELGTERYYDQSNRQRTSQQTKTSTREQKALQRGDNSHKRELAKQLKAILQRSNTHEQLQEALASLNLKLYTRGNSAGIETTGGKRYRFSTLGLAQDYSDVMSRCDLHASRLAELSRRFDERERDNDLELDFER